jgi:transcriptional regulator with XRE-family HTH domain
MPLKPRFIHPVRYVRTCLGYTQPAFAKLVGCSAIAIQRIENGSLPLSPKLAAIISEATAADPHTLRDNQGSKPLDLAGNQYSPESHEFLKNVLPFTDVELRFYLHKLINYFELLLIFANRANRFRAYGVNCAIQQAATEIAEDFGLLQGIHNFLVEKGSVDKRTYRVSDLRKFPAYAQILGFKDDKRFKPDKRIDFVITRGWMKHYILGEVPILPHGADMKLRDAEYILDAERYIPPEIKEAFDQALYWEIRDFRLLPA